MKYVVVDFYENPLGEAVHIAHDEEDARKFCDSFIEDTDGECALKVYSKDGLEWVC